jgi:hypothetical protein
MIDHHVTYGLEKKKKHASGSFGHLSVTLPRTLFQHIRTNPEVAGTIKQLNRKRRRIVEIESQPAAVKLIINENKLGKARGDKPDLLRGVVALISEVEKASGPQAADPCLGVTFGKASEEDGLYEAKFDICWPGISSDRLDELATEAMQSMALGLGYPFQDQEKRQQVFANVDRRRSGINFRTNSLQRNLVSHAYDNNVPRTTVRVAEMRSQEEQLIALTGAVAVAHAAELV